MPVIICQFCQHENKSGTRFCTECGCSIHLKICPNPDCGKISNVEAIVCESCGQTFPKVAHVPTDTSTTTRPDESVKSAENPGGGGKDKPRTAAWPLIMMAIVAGGLPLLWANRSQLPTPNTWKINASDSAKAGGAAPAPGPVNSKPSLSISPPVIPIAPVTPPSPPPSVPGSTVVGSDTPAVTSDSEKRSAPTTKNPPAKVSTAKKVAKSPRPKTAEPPPPCTEATAALGLCNPKQSTK